MTRQTSTCGNDELHDEHVERTNGYVWACRGWTLADAVRKAMRHDAELLELEQARNKARAYADDAEDAVTARYLQVRADVKRAHGVED